MEPKPKLAYFRGVLTRLWFVLCVLWTGFLLLATYMENRYVGDLKKLESTEAKFVPKPSGRPRGELIGETERTLKYRVTTDAGVYIVETEKEPVKHYFDLDKARRDFPDYKISEYLAKTRKFDARGASKEGYSTAEIIEHIATRPATERASSLPITSETFGMMLAPWIIGLVVPPVVMWVLRG